MQESSLDSNPGNATTDWTAIRHFLQRPGALSAADTAAPEVLGTHISVIFFTHDNAYKLKKPVCFDFLDYSTAAARRLSCEKEVDLNRRLAPDVYIAIVPVTQDIDGTMAVNGAGTTVEWLIKMRRLPANRMLDRLILMGKVVETEIAALSQFLVAFFCTAPVVTLPPGSYSRHIVEHVRANFAELSKPVHGFNSVTIKRIHGHQLQLIALEDQLFEDRVKSGRVIDGHGDLRPEHICMEKTPVIFDCIEFNDELRQLDAADELCFLAMECAHLGNERIGDEILAEYQRKTSDYRAPRLLEFYRSYRACVRAKVTALKVHQSESQGVTEGTVSASEYLRFADRKFGPSSVPICILVRGRIGTGKSTVAVALSDTLGMELLQTDGIRDTVVIAPRHSEVYGQGRYSLSDRIGVYEEMFRQMANSLADNISVVLDGCFLSKNLQRRALSIANTHGAKTIVVTCVCSDFTARSRIENRAKDPNCRSQAKPEHVTEQKNEDEGPLGELHGIIVDTSNNSVEEVVHEVLSCLKSLCIRGGHARRG